MNTAILPLTSLSDLLNKLRQETGKVHRALHEHPTMKASMKGTLDHKSYVQMLKAFYQPLKQLSQNIYEVPVEGLKAKIETRVKSIEQDLVNLDGNHSILETSFSDRALSCDETLGMCYVLIGSSMGASILAGNIRTALGDVPLSYLSMSPKEAGWPELIAHIRPLSAHEHPSTIKAALATFHMIESELNKEAIH